MSDRQSIVAECLQVHGTLHPDEQALLVDHWAKLDHRLQSFAGRSITLDLHVHDRDAPGQSVMLEATIGGMPPYVAKHAGRDLNDSLNHVRDEMVRQLSDAKNRTEPRHNKHLRESSRR